MVFIKDLRMVEEGKMSIGYIHYRPFDNEYGFGKTEEELNKEGVLIELPEEPQEKEGYSKQLFYNPTKKELFYDFIEVKPIEKPLTIEDLKSQLDAQDLAIAELTALVNK